MGNRKVPYNKPRLLMLTDGNIDQSSARIRAIQYIPLLEEADYSVSFIPRIPRKQTDPFLRYIYFPLMKRLLWIKRFIALNFYTWDIIFVQRLFIDEFSLNRATRKSRLIFDFDDAIFLDDNNKSAAQKAGNMINFSDQVIISTPYLNDFCIQQGKTAHIITTPVETDVITPSIRGLNELPVIGWIGSAWTTEYLRIVEPAIQELSKEAHFKFLTVGAKSGYSIDGVTHENINWEIGIESTSLSKIDIGIMPLPDTDYARAKGGYKLYLYMAAGIPCVASTVGINNTIIKPGTNGFLVNSEAEWLKALKLLIQDPTLRTTMGQNGRKLAELHYDRKVCFIQLLEILKTIIND